MSGFETRWLDLREPADRRARHAGLRTLAVEFLNGTGREARIVDLGCGTGSTLRALLPDVRTARWLLIDNDPRLLEEAKTRHGSDVDAMEFLQLDLRDIRPELFSDTSLVTASALFDLASPEFVETLASHLKASRTSLYAALNYDGICNWSSRHHADELVVAAFNEHQRGDKGLGPALGPDSGPALKSIFENSGFDVLVGKSPWKFGPDDAELHRQFIEGMAKAAAETRNLEPLLVEDWRRNRLARVTSSTCEVGHWDILALADRGCDGNGAGGQRHDCPAGAE